MPRRTAIAAFTIVLTTAGLAAPATYAAPTADTAERAEKPEQSHKGWTEADKAGFGTARNRKSRVWFTLQGGRVSEVFYPDLSTPSVRTLELTVSDGTTTDKQSTGMTTVVTRPDERSLRFTQVSTDDEGRYRITEEVVTDPARSAVVIHARLESLDGGQYELGVRYDPALGNGAEGDRPVRNKRALKAVDHESRVASALVASPTLTSVRSNTRGGDLRQMGRLAQGADGVTLSLGFGPSVQRATRTAQAARAEAWTETRDAYDAGWHDYLAGLKPVPASASSIQRQYLASALVLAAGEDKAHPGAFVASPSVPWVWGDEIKDLSDPSSAYHEVWSRDLYQIGTALYAMGDVAAAQRAVRWLFAKQQKKDGSFPQNSDTDGNEEWTELQLDQVTLPIALAHLVGQTDQKTYKGIKKAVRFLMRFRDEETGKRAPFSPQERWENQSGYSPATIAAQIDGLVTGAAIARQRGDTRRAGKWEKTADRWARKVKKWTVTSNGPLSDAPYFLRVTKDGKPNKGTTYAHRRRRPGPGRPAAGGRRELPRPGAVRHPLADRPRRRQQPRRRRPGPRRQHAERHVLAPLLLRRVRREAGRRPVGAHRRRLARDAGPGLAAACGRARGVRRRGRPERRAVPRQHGRRRQRLGHDRRAGLGRPGADRPALLPGRRGHPFRDAAAVVARGPGPAGLDDPERAPGRPAGSRGRPLPRLTSHPKSVQTGCLSRGPRR